MSSRTTIKTARWPTTQWEMLGHLSDDADNAAQYKALEKLCRAYDAPILAYLVQMGFSQHDAEDARQGFFADVMLRRNLLGRARRHRGRLRDLIRRSLRNYAINVVRAGKAARREGQSRREACEDVPASEVAAGAMAPRAESPAEAFAREWGRRVLERAYARIDEEYEKKGHAALCEALKPHLVRWAAPPSQEEAACALGISATSLSTELSRLRKRFRHVLLLLLSEEGGSPQESERDLQELLRAFAR